MDFYAYLDFETHPCSRASGMFQVIELKDSNDIDMTHLVTVGTIYNNLEHLRRELDLALGMPIPRVEVYEAD